MNQVFIILGKMDKIGLDGVAAELEESGFAKESIEKYIDLFDKISDGIDGVLYCKEKLEGFLAPEIADNMTTIIESVLEAKQQTLKLNLIRHWFVECLTIQDQSLKSVLMDLQEV